MNNQQFGRDVTYKKSDIEDLLTEKVLRARDTRFSHWVISDSFDPVDWSPPGSFVHGILQARIQECIAISSSRGSSQPRDQTSVSCTARGFFASWTTREGPWCMVNGKDAKSELQGERSHGRSIMLMETQRWCEEQIAPQPPAASRALRALCSRRDNLGTSLLFGVHQLWP